MSTFEPIKLEAILDAGDQALTIAELHVVREAIRQIGAVAVELASAEMVDSAKSLTTRIDQIVHKAVIDRRQRPMP